jgi:hypothetical protein
MVEFLGSLSPDAGWIAGAPEAWNGRFELASALLMKQSGGFWD